MSVTSADTNLFSTIKVTLERGLMSAVNVGNSLAVKPTSFDTGELTPEQSLMSAVTVGDHLARNLISFHTKEFILEKGL